MSLIKVGWDNRIEDASSVTASAGTAAGFPLYRLYDHLTSRLWKANAVTSPQYITIDYGTSVTIDSVIIPSGHNLSGTTLAIQYSSDNFVADTNDLISNFAAGSGFVVNTAGASQNARYWRLKISNVSSAPQIGELFFTIITTFTANAKYGLRSGQQRNVARVEAYNGRNQYIMKSVSRKRREYEIVGITSAEKTLMEAWEAEFAGTKHFYISDHEGNQYFAELRNEMIFVPVNATTYSCNLVVLEIISQTSTTTILARSGLRGLAIGVTT